MRTTAPAKDSGRRRHLLWHLKKLDDDIEVKHVKGRIAIEGKYSYYYKVIPLI